MPRPPLRLEPYNPDARDADGDGIVQERTAWERPAGTRIISALGREIARGSVEPQRLANWQVVDKSGTPIDYVPSYAKRAKLPQSRFRAPLEKRGFPTIESRGIRSLDETVTEAIIVGRARPLASPAITILPESEVLREPSSDIVLPDFTRSSDSISISGSNASTVVGSARTPDDLRDVIRSATIKHKNKQIADEITRLGGSLAGDFDDQFVTNNSEFGFERARIETKDEALERRNKQVRSSLGAIREALLSGGPTDGGAIRVRMDTNLTHGTVGPSPITQRDLDRMSPAVKQLILDKSDDEILEILERRAMDFHTSVDRRSRVRMPERVFASFVKDGRYKTTHETKSSHSGPDIRKQYETYLGIPGAIDPSFRPASGYIHHSDWEEASLERVRKHLNLPADTSDERLLASIHTGPNIPHGAVDVYGDVEVILRPEVSSRTRYGRSDSLSNFLRPVGFESDDPQEVMHALLWAEGRDSDRGASNISDLLQSEVDGHFKNLNFWHASYGSDGQLDENVQQRQYFEALIFGSFSPGDVEEIRVSSSQMIAIGIASDPEIFDKEVMNSRMRTAEFLESFGFTEEEIKYILSKENEWNFDGWFKQYREWKQREKARQVIDSLDVKVTILRDTGVDKDPFLLESYAGHEVVNSIEELMIQRTIDIIRKDMERAQRRIIESANRPFNSDDEEESVA